MSTLSTLYQICNVLQQHMEYCACDRINVKCIHNDLNEVDYLQIGILNTAYFQNHIYNQMIFGRPVYMPGNHENAFDNTYHHGA